MRKRVLVIIGWHNPKIVQGFCRFAREADWILDTYSLMTGSIPESWHGQGILATNVTDRILKVRLESLAARLPVVLHGTNVTDKDYPSSEIDEHMTGQLAAEHLLARGYGHFATLMQGTNAYAVRRRDGFEATVKAAGHHPVRWNLPPTRAQPAMNWIARNLARMPKPLALFAEDDLLAAAVIDAAKQVDWQVPRELGVVGVGDNPVICEYSRIPISSVQLPAEQQAYEAARLLDQLMRAKRPPRRHIVLPPSEVIVRQSSDHLAVNHPALRRAVEFIRESFTNPDITVGHIARAGGVSPSKLHLLFRDELRTTPGDLLQRCRMDRARHLLVNTEEKTNAIAATCGFTCVRTFQRSFKALYGQHPTDWRNRTA